jgi:hypothetical protein
MGWLFFPKPDNVKAYLNKQCKNGRYKLLRSAIVNRTEYYAAVEHTAEDGTRTVSAVICLLRFIPRARDGATFGYKDMDEDMGPNAARCPKQILALLTPPSTEYAAKWRESCEAYHRAGMVKTGTVIRFKNPLTFIDGPREDHFTVWRKGGKVRFRRMTDGILVRITNWKERGFEVVN